MAGPNKRKKQQAEELSSEEEIDMQPQSNDSSSNDEFPSGDESEEQSESEEDEDGAAFDSIDVDFEFYDPQEKDFLGLKTLLTGLLDGEQWNCSELVDAIIKQSVDTGVGTVIKCGEEDDPIGVLTVLSLPQYGQHLESLRQLRTHLEAHCPDARSRQQLAAAWVAPATGLVLNERLINCPPQLAVPLQEALFSEIQMAADDEELVAQARDAFCFRQYLMLVRAYTDPPAQQRQGNGAGSSKQQQKKKKPEQQQRAAAAQHAGTGLVHVLPEAECYQQHAVWTFHFPTPGRLVAKDELEQCRALMLVPAAAVPTACRQLNALLGATDAV